MSMHPRIVGRSESDPLKKPTCLHCKKEFKGGNKGDPGVNVYSKDGMREIAITGMCELCFDGLFDEGDEDEGDYCGGCNPEPTVGELESGWCASCGKELP